MRATVALGIAGALLVCGCGSDTPDNGANEELSSLGVFRAEEVPGLKQVPEFGPAAAFSQNGRLLVANSFNGNPTVWDVESGKQIVRLPKPGWSIGTVRLAFDQDGFLEVAAGPEYGLWRPREEQAMWLLRRFEEGFVPFECLHRRTAREVLFLAAPTRTDITVVTDQGGKPLRTLKTTEPLISADLDPTETKLAVLTGPQTGGGKEPHYLEIWSMAPWKMLYRSEDLGFQPQAVRFNPRREQVAVCGPEGLRLIDLQGGRVRSAFERDTIMNVSYSPNGSYLAVAPVGKLAVLESETCTIVASAEDKKEVSNERGKFTMASSGVTAFGPNGLIATTNAMDPEVRLWSFRPLATQPIVALGKKIGDSGEGS